MKFECSACGSVANIAIAMLQLQLPQPATQWQQQLQWQLAQFQLLLLGASSVVVFSVLFLPPAACSALFAVAASADAVADAPATSGVIFRLRLVQLQLATTSFVLPWPKLAMRATALLLSPAWQIF